MKFIYFKIKPSFLLLLLLVVGGNITGGTINFAILEFHQPPPQQMEPLANGQLLSQRCHAQNILVI